MQSPRVFRSYLTKTFKLLKPTVLNFDDKYKYQDNMNNAVNILKLGNSRLPHEKLKTELINTLITKIICNYIYTRG